MALTYIEDVDNQILEHSVNNPYMFSSYKNPYDEHWKEKEIIVQCKYCKAEHKGTINDLTIIDDPIYRFSWTCSKCNNKNKFK